MNAENSPARLQQETTNSSPASSPETKSDLTSILKDPRRKSDVTPKHARINGSSLNDGLHLNVSDLNVNDSKKKATQLPVPSIYRTRHIVASAPDLEAIIVTEYTAPALTNAHKAPQFNGCKPLAILLRFRVAQIASGFCTFLLGCSALLDAETRGTLYLACIAGILCVLCTALHIVDCRKKGPQGLQYIFPSVHVTITVILAMLTVVSVIVSCVLRAVSSQDKNVYKLSIAQTIAVVPWCAVELVTISLRIVWAKNFIS